MVSAALMNLLAGSWSTVLAGTQPREAQSKYAGMELEDTWEWLNDRESLSGGTVERMLDKRGVEWDFRGPGSDGSGHLRPPPTMVGTEAFYDEIRRAELYEGEPRGQARVEHNPLGVFSDLGKTVTGLWGYEDPTQWDIAPMEYGDQEGADDEPLDRGDDDDEDDDKTVVDNEDGTTSITNPETGDVTNIYNTYNYDPNASQDIARASSDGLFGGSSGLFGIMLIMMMMQPMMQGNGMRQVVRAEPIQSDISGMFYG